MVPARHGWLELDGAVSLPAQVQRTLTGYYALEAQPEVDAFVSSHPDVTRERVLVRASADGVEIAVELPPMGDDTHVDLDAVCQIVEGVSHFVLLADRARRELPTTELELELQAELDKFLLLAVARERPLEPWQARALHERLFGHARFLHPAGTERGDRYRTAHALAERFTAALARRYLATRRHRELCAILRRFYHASPNDKLALARAA
ncbi:MAG: hypothetical protein HY908_17780 [Myxococcales bacterium]|nr:hypothetical protein [Myxococcales bacterium]